MKVLIVYASAGAGHRRAAEAIYENLDDSLRQHTRLVDILDFTPPLFKFIYARGYRFLFSHLAFIWSFFYWLTSLKFLFPLFNSLEGLINLCCAHRFSRFIANESPAVILSTHFMPNEILSRLKRNGLISSYIISVITDYAIHPFWISTGVDRYIVALDFLKPVLVKKGVNENKIDAFGIPVAKYFYDLKPREQAAKEIGVNANKFSVLLVTGEIGFNILGQITEDLKRDVQTFVICGRNKRMFEKLKRLNSENIFAFSLVQNMYDFLACSDIIITKAGGLTISESLVANVPMCFICKISGQEEENIKVFTKLGCAIYDKQVQKIVDWVLETKNNPDKILLIKKNIEMIAKPNAAKDIIALIKTYVR
jgi:processive 1,2-diacylglycerol beta-glucosyltransferase